MLTIILKDQVQKSIATQWPAFCINHPRLAEVIDQTLLVEEAIAQLSASPEYQQALQQASLYGLGAQSLAGLLDRLVGDFLKRVIS